MHTTQSIIILTNKNSSLLNRVTSICKDENFSLTKVESIIQTIETCNLRNFNVAILDGNNFEISQLFIDLLKSKQYYVPQILILGHEKASSFINALTFSNILDLTNTFNSISNEFNEPINTPQNSFLRNIISNEIENIGFSVNYKGFNYLIDIILKTINNPRCSSSFNKYAYPYIAQLYNTNPSCVERDVRNLINNTVSTQKFTENVYLNGKPSTKNVFNKVLSYVKTKLNIIK